MYYLQSRYYMPYLYRFLNADDPKYAKVGKDDTAGINLFAYCNNDPVNKSDPSGKVAQYIIMGAIGGVLSLFLYWIDCRIDKVSMKFWKAVGNFSTGIANGVSSALGLSLWKSIATNVVISVSSFAFSSSISQETIIAEICISVIIGIVSGIVGGTSVKSNKFISSVEKKCVKKLANSIRHGKGIKPIINALKYAFKHTKKIFVGFIRSFFKSSKWAIYIKYGSKAFRRLFA